MKRKNDYSAPIVGGTSLITIFATICLIVFTLLTLSTVVASRNLAFASHEAVKDHYNADSQAEAVFAALRRGECPESVKIDGDFYSYNCPISDTQTLEVELSFVDGRWDIIKWCAVSTNN